MVPLGGRQGTPMVHKVPSYHAYGCNKSQGPFEVSVDIWTEASTGKEGRNAPHHSVHC